MKSSWIGIDIGGANIKIACHGKPAIRIPFKLWQQPQQLAPTLLQTLSALDRIDRLAVTMTGELADCFTDKRHGVEFICDAVEEHFSHTQPLYYQTNGQFVGAEVAKANYLQTAASNWHALATAIAAYQPNCIVLDIGSTTTDIIPVADGKVVATGSTDLSRLQHCELVYTGAARTPLCAVAQTLNVDGILVPVAAEFFCNHR